MTVLTGYLRLIYRLPLMLLHLLIATPSLYCPLLVLFTPFTKIIFE